MHIQAIWPEIQNAVMKERIGWVLNKDLELVGDVVREWLVGDHAGNCAGDGPKQC